MKLAYVISASPTRFAAVAQGRDVAASIRHLAVLGYHGVELAIRDPAQVRIDEIAGAAERAGVIVPAIGTGRPTSRRACASPPGTPRSGSRRSRGSRPTCRGRAGSARS